MKILVTGASGFVAPVLALELERAGHEVVLTSRSAARTDVRICDLADAAEVAAMVADIRPDAVAHLAGETVVGKSWENRPGVVQGNVLTTQNLCAALHRLGRPVTFLYTSTALVFAVREDSQSALSESDPVGTEIPYGLSKIAAENVVSAYRSDRFRTYIARPFNHIGPGQSPEFVCAALAQRIAAARDGDEIRVGNVSSSRDFSDVRDIARAYRLILEKKPASPLFVLGSGRAVTIKSVLERLIAISGKRLTVARDPSLERPVDPKIVVSDPRRALKELGWKCEIPLEQTLKEIYQDALLKVSS